MSGLSPIAPACLVDQRRRHGRHLRGVETVEHALTQRLRHGQVQFAVQMTQQLARLRQPVVRTAVALRTFQITQRIQHAADAVELAGHRTGPRLVAVPDAFQLAGLPSPTMPPGQVSLQIRALPARMLLLGLAQARDPAVQLAHRLPAFLLGRKRFVLDPTTVVALQIRQPHTQRHELAEIAVVAVERLLVALQGLLQRHHLRFQLSRGFVRLPLGEGVVERDACGVHIAGIEQIHRHVEGRAEAGMQRVDAFAGQRGGRGRHEAVMVHHHGVADRIDASAAGAAGQLGELPRRQRHMARAVELLQLLHHHAAGRHIDAQRQRLGGEHHLDQSLFEQPLDDLPEQRHHARMMGGEALLQSEAEPGEPQRLEVLRAQLAVDHLIDDAADTPHLVLGGQLQSGVQALIHGLVAAVAGEDERDARQQTEIVEFVDHGPTARHMPFRFALRLMRATGSPAFPAAVAVARAPGRLPVELIQPADQMRVQRGGRAAIGVMTVQVDELRLGPIVGLHEHMLLQRHGPVLGDDQRGLAAHRGEPAREILHVGDRGRQRHDADAPRQVDDDLLPHRPAEPVGQIMDLVQDDVPQRGERG